MLKGPGLEKSNRNFGRMKKNWLTLTLMFASIGLLLVLQGVWLQSVYNNIKRDLKKETSLLFSSTVMTMQDSVIEKNIKPLPGDSTAEFFGNVPLLRDTFKFHHQHTEIHRSTGTEVIYLSSGEPKDSLRRFFRTMVSKFGANRKQRTFVMKLTMDSLKPESIHKNFSRTLRKADLPLTFSVVHLDGKGPKHEPRWGFSTEPFPFPPRGSFYGAVFPDIRIFILKKIAPQLLFSVFLTLLTGVSFFLMYRSIRSSQRLIEIKNDFIGNITHELKTPIATVSVAIEALKNFKGLNDPELTQEYLGIAQQELNRLSLLTDKILRTAIFEDQGIDMLAERIDLEKIVTQVLTALKLVLEKHQVNISFEKRGNDFTIDGSVDHLTNVLYNLVDNAVKYGGDRPTVKILLCDVGDKISISVQDKGLGIPAQYQRRIFEKFFRVPAGDVSNTKGYGLGLSYVESVVHKHRGTISLDSAPGAGSTFVITLPKNLVP